jgi:hypothetical protein
MLELKFWKKKINKTTLFEILKNFNSGLFRENRDFARILKATNPSYSKKNCKRKKNSTINVNGKKICRKINFIDKISGSQISMLMR